MSMRIVWEKKNVASGVAENTRWDTCRRQLCLGVNLSPIFWIVVLRRERYSNKGVGAPKCGGAQEMKTAQSF